MSRAHTTDKFFTTVARINSVLFLLILLGVVLGVLGSMAYDSLRPTSPVPANIVVSEAASGESKPLQLRLGEPQSMVGTGYLMMRLETRGQGAKFASGGSDGETRNLLLINAAQKHSNWVFKDQQNNVTDISQLHPSESTKQDTTTTALYFEYTTAADRAEGSATPANTFRVGLSKPDGTSFVEVLQDIDRVLSKEMPDAQHLRIVYKKGTSIRTATYLVDSFKSEDDQEIINVPRTL
jgi:hypothetical protein